MIDASAASPRPFPERARASVYLAWDRLHGGEFARATEALDRFATSGTDRIGLLSQRQTVLAHLLSHASQTTIAYRACGPALKDFPIVTKDALQQMPQSYLSSRYTLGDLKKVKTSGSTGTPLTWFQDRDKRSRVAAEVVHYSQLAGYRLGSQLIFLRALTGHYRAPRLRQIAQNQRQIDISRVDGYHLSHVLEKLRRQCAMRRTTILAYASTLRMIARHIDSEGTAHWGGNRLTAIVSHAESLDAWTRGTLEAYFGVPVVSRYSNSENGIVGQELNEHDTFQVNQLHYIVEVLDLQSQAPARVGELGRVVITDLYNFGAPLIRYDTGDVARAASVAQPNSTEATALTGLSGRLVDIIYDAQERPLSPFAINNIMTDQAGVQEYRFTQVGKGRYNLTLVSHAHVLDLRSIERGLKSLVGPEATIVTDFVDEIPALTSGKRPYVTSEYAPPKRWAL